MKCKLCGNKSASYKKIKKGKICDCCFGSIPQFMRDDVAKLSASQLLEIKKIIKSPRSESWASCNGNVEICDKAIIISDWEIAYKDIKSIRLRIRPEEAAGNKVIGILNIVVETKYPHLLIEDKFMKINTNYRINGEDIIYEYPRVIIEMFENIQTIIDDMTYNMSRFNPENIAKRKLYEEEIKRRQYEKEFKRKTYEEYRHRRYRKSKTNTNHSNGNQRRENYNKAQKKVEYDVNWAKKVYGLQMPFTKSEIKKKRNELIKKYHPDAGGNDEKCKEIINAYEILVKHAG